VIYKQNASLKKRLVMVRANDLFPDCGHITVISVQGSEQGWSELHTGVLKRSSE
jgi:hypothetical protein